MPSARRVAFDLTRGRRSGGYTLAVRLGVDCAFRILYRVTYPVYQASCIALGLRLRGAHVLLWCGDRLLVVRHSYKRGLALPAGLVHRRESPRAAAARELAEEVGVEVAASSMTALGEFATQCERVRDRIHVFQIEVPVQPSIAIDRREIVWAEFMSLTELTRRADLRPTLTEILHRFVLPSRSPATPH